MQRPPAFSSRLSVAFEAEGVHRAFSPQEEKKLHCSWRKLEANILERPASSVSHLIPPGGSGLVRPCKSFAHRLPTPALCARLTTKHNSSTACISVTVKNYTVLRR